MTAEVYWLENRSSLWKSGVSDRLTFLLKSGKRKSISYLRTSFDNAVVQSSLGERIVGKVQGLVKAGRRFVFLLKIVPKDAIKWRGVLSISGHRFEPSLRVDIYAQCTERRWHEKIRMYFYTAGVGPNAACDWANVLIVWVQSLLDNSELMTSLYTESYPFLFFYNR